MAAKNTAWALPTTYFDLVEQFPLTHLQDDDHLDAAQKMLDRLLQEDLDEGEQRYLDVLTDLVENYEEKHVSIRDASESEVLHELMRSNGLSQPKLAKVTGIAQSTLSAVLNGSRSLTKDQVVKLASFFNVSPLAFLSDSPGSFSAISWSSTNRKDNGKGIQDEGKLTFAGASP